MQITRLPVELRAGARSARAPGSDAAPVGQPAVLELATMAIAQALGSSEGRHPLL